MSAFRLMMKDRCSAFRTKGVTLKHPVHLEGML